LKQPIISDHDIISNVDDWKDLDVD
jgi:hypothetical protein